MEVKRLYIFSKRIEQDRIVCLARQIPVWKMEIKVEIKGTFYGFMRKVVMVIVK